MFVTVRYGEDRSKIFNADCKNENLLENIKLQCGCGRRETVEVCDERGVIKNLRNFPAEYGSHFLKQRETLVLLTVTDADDGHHDKPYFTPLLTCLRNDREFNDTLNQDSLLDLRDTSSPTAKRPAPSESDDDLNKSFRNRMKSNNSTGSTTNTKKSILRKSTKSSLRK